MSLVSLSNDPKHKSVENLMDQLTRSQPSYSGQPSSPTYYSTTDEYSQVESTPQLLQPRTMPLPPKPGRAPSPPKPERSSPPQPVAQQPRRPVESPLGQVHMPPMRREKDSSPRPCNTWKGEGRAKDQSEASMVIFLSVPSTYACFPSSQHQNIVFDVSQLLDDAEATRHFWQWYLRQKCMYLI
jgi:hypothetical protein